jgi:hypothetical protein
MRNSDDAAHVLCGACVEQPQAEHRIGIVCQAQSKPRVLLLQRRLLLLDERVVGCQGDDGRVCFLKLY